MFADTGPHSDVISIPQCSASWMSSEEVGIWECPGLPTCALPAVTEAPFSASGPFRIGEQLEAGHIGRDSDHVTLAPFLFKIRGFDFLTS